jgi:hypothetical protein
MLSINKYTLLTEFKDQCWKVGEGGGDCRAEPERIGRNHGRRHSLRFDWRGFPSPPPGLLGGGRGKGKRNSCGLKTD